MAAKRKTRTQPPQHEGEEVKVRISIDVPQSLYLNGIWVSPGEEAFVAADAARELIREGKAEAVA